MCACLGTGGATPEPAAPPASALALPLCPSRPNGAGVLGSSAIPSVRPSAKPSSPPAPLEDACQPQSSSKKFRIRTFDMSPVKKERQEAQALARAEKAKKEAVKSEAKSEE